MYIRTSRWLVSTIKPATTLQGFNSYPTPGWHYACSESGYADSKISLEWLKRVFDPQTRERADQKPRVLICDGFGTHEPLEILKFCFEILLNSVFEIWKWKLCFGK